MQVQRSAQFLLFPNSQQESSSSSSTSMEPRAQGFEILPTPDPTIAICISDEDVALQLMRLIESPIRSASNCLTIVPIRDSSLCLEHLTWAYLSFHLGRHSDWTELTISVKLKKIPPGPLKPTGHKMFRWKKDFPGVMRPRSFEQKTSYRYRLVHNNDYIFEIARYDVYGTLETSTDSDENMSKDMYHTQDHHQHQTEARSLDVIYLPTPPGLLHCITGNGTRQLQAALSMTSGVYVIFHWMALIAITYSQ